MYMYISTSLDSGRCSLFWSQISLLEKKVKKNTQNQKSIYSSSKVLKISELFCLYVKRSKMMSFLEIRILGHPIPLFSKMTWYFKSTSQIYNRFLVFNLKC